MKVLLLFCLAGFAFGFQPTLKYKYHYEGVTETGIPEINTEGAAVGIKLIANIEVNKEGHAVIQFKDIKVGEHHGCFGCDRKFPISNNQFTTIKDAHTREIMEQPFVANLFGKEDYAMILETEEILWLKNIRRAIVGLFRSYLLHGNFDCHDHLHMENVQQTDNIPKIFSLMEETILGTCEVHYTVHKVEGSLAAELNQMLEKHGKHGEHEHGEDVQRDHIKHAELKASKYKTSKKYSSKSSKSRKFSKVSSKYSRKDSVPELADDLYHVTRTLNFDNCKHNVVLKHSSGRVDFKAGTSTYSWYGARSSVGEYVFRGSSGAFRLESAVVEGAITAKAFGIADESVTTNTKQILHLISVEELSSPKVISPSIHIKGWMQEVLSPFKTPQVSAKVPWVTYTGDDSMTDAVELVVGIKHTKAEIAARKEYVIQCLKFAAKALAAEKPSDEVAPEIVMEKIKGIKLTLETLPKQTIEEILEEIMVEDNTRPHEIYEQKLIVDAIEASGTKRATQIVLNLIKTKKLSSFQALLISATGMQTFHDVSAIPDVADFVTELSMRTDPFVASTVLINFANMVHHYCIHPSASTEHYAGALFGDEGCNVDHLKTKFLPYITNIINDETKSWERVIAIKVLHRLAISQTVDIVGPIALGQKGSSEQVRLAAIYAISRWTLPYSSRDHSMHILSEIYTNVGEIPRLRSAALIMYSSWGPEPSFFFKLARLSWREPSMAVASFYKSLINAFAETSHPFFIKQNQAATHAIKLTRPGSPSMFYPFISREFKSTLDGQVSKVQEVGMFNFPYPEPRFNFDVYSFLMHSMNGISMTVSEVLVSSGGIGDFIKNTFEKYETHNIHSKVVEDLYNKIQNVIHAEPSSHREETLVTVYFRIFENMQFLFPITKETIEASQFTDPIYLSSLLLELQTGLTRSLGKFFTLASFREFVPNEMGLPVFSSGTGDVVFADTFNARLSVSTSSMTEIPKKAHLFVEEYFKLMTEVSGDMSIIVPWSNSRISTNIRSIRGVSHPVLTTLNVDTTSKSRQPIVSASFESAYDSKVSILKAKTIPLTRIDSLSFTGQTRKPSIIMLVKHDNIHKVVKVPQTYTGLDHTLTWDAQFRYPLDLYGIKSLFKRSSKREAFSEVVFLLSSYTAQYWSLDLEFDPANSETKNVTIDFTFQLTCNKKQMEHISQDSQTAGNLDYGQEEFMQYGQEEFNQYGQAQFDSGKEEFQIMDLSEVENHGGVNINDNFQQKSAKMTEHYGSKANTIGFTLAYHGDNTRKYELFYSWSKPSYANLRKKVKSQLTLLRTPIPGFKEHKALSVCIDTQKVTPIMSGFDTLESVLNRNLDVEISRSVTPDCQGKPIIVIEATMKITPERIQQLRREVPEDCHFDSFDPLHTFYNAVYDDIHANIKWEDVCDKKRLPILTKAINALDKAFFKGFYAFECESKHMSNQLDLHLKRCLKTDLWHFQAKRDSYSFNIDDVPSNEFVDFFFSVRALAAQRVDQLLGQNKGSDKCVIKHGEVRTFDGVVYKYEPTQCWTVAAKDCKSDRFLVLVRASTTESTVPEVRVIDRENSLVINNIQNEKPDASGITDHYSKVNGKLVAKIYQQDNHYIILLPKRVQVAITDHVSIKILTKEVCGICGTNDNEKIIEFMGPKHCVYTKPEHFITAWTAGGETCNMHELLTKRTEVEAYQKTCRSVYDMFSHVPTYQKMYTEYRYIIKEIGNKYCISFHSYPQCPQGFFSMNSNTIHVTLNCWNKNNAPEKISSSLQQGIGHVLYPVDYRPSSTEISLVKIDVSCIANPK